MPLSVTFLCLENITKDILEHCICYYIGSFFIFQKEAAAAFSCDLSFVGKC